MRLYGTRKLCLSYSDKEALKHLKRIGTAGILPSRIRCSHCEGNMAIEQGEVFCLRCGRRVKQYKTLELVRGDSSW